jgi:hypothetical protein
MRWAGGLVLLVALAGCGGHGPPGTLHRADGVTYRLPAGWRAAPSSLTPHLVDPHELFTAGTGRLAARPARCAHVPSAALAAMRPDDVLVSVQERFSAHGDFAPRPQRFALGPSNTSVLRPCAGLHSAVRTYWREFRDGERGFHVLVAVGPSAPRARVDQALAILDSMRFTHDRAARFPVRPGWHTRVSAPRRERCLRQRASWAATVPFTDAPFALPPHAMIEALPPDGVILVAMQWRECKRLHGMPVLNPPLRLRRATRTQFPGPRGDVLPLYRLRGRLIGRYYVDVWAFFGRRHPTRAQWTAAQRELGGVRWAAF